VQKSPPLYYKVTYASIKAKVRGQIYVCRSTKCYKLLLLGFSEEHFVFFTAQPKVLFSLLYQFGIIKVHLADFMCMVCPSAYVIIRVIQSYRAAKYLKWFILHSMF
jgi:hypothetical protein